MALRQGKRQTRPWMSRSIVTYMVLQVLWGGGQALHPSHAQDASHRPAAEVPYSTPSGITLVEILSDVGLSTKVDWIRLGDADGNTLYVFDGDKSGVSSCTDDCVEVFVPVAAPESVEVPPNWGVTVRSDGARQWTYYGMPLYRYARETKINEVVDNLQLLEKQKKDTLGLSDYSLPDDALLPPEGWRVARFDPARQIALPATIRVGDLPRVNSVGLVNSDGYTIYRRAELPGKAEQTKCLEEAFCWQPVPAPALAQTIGDFVPVAGEDGTPQWSYKGHRLFTYRGDAEPGDVNGLSVGDDGWSIAAIVRHFVPDTVAVRDDEVLGPLLSTTAGKPLYSRYVMERLSRKRTEDDVPYKNGKLLGLKGCDEACLEVWQPLEAGEAAIARGFWEPYERENGLRQWAYKGFAQFTHAQDDAKGPVTGNNSYVYVTGSDRYAVEDTLPEVHPMSQPAAFVWRVSDVYPRY